MKTNIHFLLYISQISSEKNISDKVIEKMKTHSMIKNVFRKWRLSWENVRKYCTGGQTADDNMAQAHWMLDTEGYRHTLRICNTYCFYMATADARKRFNVTFINNLAFLFFTKRNGRNMMKNLYWSSCKASVVFVLFYWNLNFLVGFWKILKYQIS
jgi:hypothetical protein